MTVWDISDKRLLIMKKFFTHRYAAYLLILSLLFFSMACQNKNEKVPENTPGSGKTEPVQKISMNRGGSQINETEEPEVEKEESETSMDIQFSGPVALQQILPQSRILPDGDYCGPFMDLYSADQTERDLANLIMNFFNSYSLGILDEQFLWLERNTPFQDELEQFLSYSSEILSFQAGSFQISATRAHTRIRLFSETGSITAVLYLVNDQGLWYLEDWELPLDDWPGNVSAD